MVTLNEISQEYQNVLAMTEETGGELTAEILEKLSEVEQDMNKKVDGYCRIISMYKAHEKAVDEEIKRLQARKKVNQNNARQMRSYLQHHLTESGLIKLDTGLHKVTISNGKPSVAVVDQSKIPPDYINAILHLSAFEIPEELFDRAELIVDKKAIYEAITQSGMQIEGIELKESKNLRIT